MSTRVKKFVIGLKKDTLFVQKHSHVHNIFTIFETLILNHNVPLLKPLCEIKRIFI
jgi:hypothetical protein